MKLAADDVQTLVIPGCGHYCLEEAPGEILAALTAFAAQLACTTSCHWPVSMYCWKLVILPSRIFHTWQT